MSRAPAPRSPAAPADPGTITQSCATDGTGRDFEEPMQVLRDYPGIIPEDHVPFPRAALDGSVPERFEAMVRLHPGRTALRTPSRIWSYAGLNTSANHAAHAILRDRTPSPVALLMDQEDPAVPALFGALKSARPCLFLDPGDPAERWQALLDASGAGTLITTEARLPRTAAVRIGRRLSWEELDSGPRDDNPGLNIAPDAPAAFYFTSGSTGTPKGVLRDHRIFLQTTWFNTNTYFISPSDRQSLLYFPGFGASMPNIYDTLMTGASICALNPRRVPPSGLLAWLGSEGVTHLNPPIGLWRALLASVQGRVECPALRLVTLGGQQIYGRDVRDFRSRLGQGTAMVFMLAMTEAGPVARAYLDHSTPVCDGPVPAGYPVEDKTVAILDGSGKPVPHGEEGRVAVTSEFISREYWNDEPLSARLFHRDADGGAVTFLTEDRGMMRPDGCLEYFGRADSVVKIRGYRVDPGAVEAVLNGHPSILHAAVAAVVRDGGEPKLAAYVVPRDAALSRPEIRAFVAARLPSYMVPDHVVSLREMPLTVSGKINRRALPAPGTSRPEMRTPFVAPRNGTEARVAAIWEELLDMDGIGVDDDFFELGGDSLMAMRMALTVEERLSLPLPPDFFRAPTVAELAGALDGTAQPAAEEGGRAWPDEPGRPSLLRRLWRIAADGPAAKGCCLPYSPGLTLQKLMLAHPWVRKRFRDKLDLVRLWADELGSDADRGELASVSLMANTWRVWRARALESPSLSGQWLRIDDPNRHLTNGGSGIVLAVPHTGRIGSVLLELFARSGRETAAVANEPALGPKDGSAAWRRGQTLARSEMVWHAQQVLRRGGVVLIAADGLHGDQSVAVPFFGRTRPFQIGAAELAVTSGATFVPVLSGMDRDGRVWLEMGTALQAEGDTPQARIGDLTRRYAQAYVRGWPRIFASMNWDHLAYNLGLPPE